MKKSLIVCGVLLALAAAVQADVKRSTLDKRLVRTVESFEDVVESETGPIPPELVARAQGILIYRQFGAGFWVGGKGGFGVAMARTPDGRWSPPAFLKTIEGSFGLQIGVQEIDLVFLFMEREAMKVFDGGKFRIGVDAAAAAGPVGAKVEGKIGAPILVYSDNAGLYVGATFEGGVMLPDREANESFYCIPRITVPDILYKGGLPFPASAESLRRVLENYAGYGRTRAGYRAPNLPENRSVRPYYNNGGVH